MIGLLFLVPSSMLSTVSALSAQNIGAGRNDRAVLTLRYATLIAVGFGVIASITVQFTSEFIVGLFTKDSDPQVIILGGQYLRSYIWDCVFAGVHFCFSGYFCACGLSGISFLHNSVSIVCARIPIAYLASKYFTDTLFPMGVAAPAGSLVSVMICVIAFLWLNRRNAERHRS